MSHQVMDQKSITIEVPVHIKMMMCRNNLNECNAVKHVTKRKNTANKISVGKRMSSVG